MCALRVFNSAAAVAAFVMLCCLVCMRACVCVCVVTLFSISSDKGREREREIKLHKRKLINSFNLKQQQQ